MQVFGFDEDSKPVAEKEPEQPNSPQPEVSLSMVDSNHLTSVVQADFFYGFEGFGFGEDFET